ncbi:hypothetical protein COU60_01435 [Candidatus Pacearchaeota archaeon CG10_big_fil_rev_8_21_14_0_10_34_76]|nr:MAG: hypothetical protein COU60_01435 [Candidatus Pacearchaeota archaeon CG10_big_fil_rev_8_21_14_0_10_34_76]
MNYDELYEYLRKEKYSEQLQVLPKNFVIELGEYFREKKQGLVQGDMFSNDSLSEKKQFENSISIFKELMLRRKKKILNLVFVASETGIMKKDFGNLLLFEQELFDNLINSVNEADKSLNDLLIGKDAVEKEFKHKMVLMEDDMQEFVDMEGKLIGPFNKGALINIDGRIADMLVSDGKAKMVDE